MYDLDPATFLDAAASLSRSHKLPARDASDRSGSRASTPAVLADAGFGDTSQHGPDREAGGQFTLGQNYPNPYLAETTVPFTLTNAADVQLTIYDPLSRKVASVVRKGMSAGSHQIALNFRGLQLPEGEYIYQLQVSNRHGVFRLRRTMQASFL